MVRVSVIDPQFCGIPLCRSLLGRALPKIISTDGWIRGLFRSSDSDFQLIEGLTSKRNIYKAFIVA